MIVIALKGDASQSCPFIILSALKGRASQGNYTSLRKTYRSCARLLCAGNAENL
jgi:hypothetical protein